MCRLVKTHLTSEGPFHAIEKELFVTLLLRFLPGASDNLKSTKRRKLGKAHRNKIAESHVNGYLIRINRKFCWIMSVITTRALTAIEMDLMLFSKKIFEYVNGSPIF